ncbi:aspartyl aminopeptidase [Anaerobacterium chartisolvens]|uniref:M18 family aminopeptidase n=1 Tax=Anaerobacterium chartisolvens TaxID=1297424 RepID=A0A369B691_9FIRM|nr:aminopeptidase [Anaerobacterium chartisolvens]RCX16845.1 aspartyl aminopeptidase [Anaerobacterium chartisolvens]
MKENKTKGQELQEKLAHSFENAWEKQNKNDEKKVFEFSENYKKFLDIGKTEREFAAEAEKSAISAGFISIDKAVGDNNALKPGMKVYEVIRGKSIMLAIIGSKPLREGVNIIGAHIDSPRIDLKQNPLYEDTGMIFLKTHYYGGIKKYQWVTIPLALHGVIIKGDGSCVSVNIGEDEKDEVFTITDLLPHLAADQMQKKMSEGITGEGLNALAGSIPYEDEKVKDKIKLNVLRLLNDKYGITEEDFISAELELVPAFKARDVGFDRSMVGAYGQDDRVCAYGALMALLDTESTEKTAVCILTDKEEIGSMGNTGAESVIFENFIASLCFYTDNSYSDIVLRTCLKNSRMLSADVNPGVDPNYEGVQEKRNASYLGKGLVVQKYTGSRGKSGGSDANAEYVGYVRRLFNSNGIIWQTGELGKVDQGGGGTIAQYIANLGVEVIDCGVPILSMHAPFEITSKIDIFINYRANKVFYTAKE